MGPIQTPLIQILLTSLNHALSLGFSFSLWKEQLKIILNEIILSLKSHPAQNFQPLSPLGRQSIWDVLVAVVWRLKIFLPQWCLPLFLSMPTIPSFKYLLLKHFAMHHMLFVAKHIFGSFVWYRTYFQLFRHFLRLFLAKVLLFWPGWMKESFLLLLFLFFFILLIIGYSEMLPVTYISASSKTAGLPFHCLPWCALTCSFPGSPSPVKNKTTTKTSKKMKQQPKNIACTFCAEGKKSRRQKNGEVQFFKKV